MTANRDSDALLRAYLADGMTELPDRVIDAIVADIHVTRQRARWGSWRFPAMSRTLIGAAAAVIAVAVAGTVWLGWFRAAPGVGGPSPSIPAVPTATAPASPPAASPSSAAPSGSPAPADLSVGLPYPADKGVITGGQTYHSVGFSAPLAFTLPIYAANPTSPATPGGSYNAQTFADHHVLNMFWASGAYAITIMDDVRLNRDLCRPTADVLPDVPAPDAVGPWLHGIAGVTVTDRPDLTVEGRTAKVWDVVVATACDEPSAPPGGAEVWFSRGEQHRIYAVPTGDDTILVVTWPGPGLEAKENPETDRLVKSLQFH